MQCLIRVRNFKFQHSVLRTFSNTSTTGYQQALKNPPKVNVGNSNSNTRSSQIEEQGDGNEQPSLRQHKMKLKIKDEGSLATESREFLNGEVESWKWLAQYGPGYATHGSNVQILETPDEYYEVLLQKSKSAIQRITLASLYLGIGTLEHQLVSTIKARMEENPELGVKLLLDHARGSRGQVSSRTMLMPLLSSSSCQVFLYHTPTLRGVRKKVLPQGYNELIGLQHMKVYIFDDSVLITGANLSNDYFTNRQDRYILIENCQELADFYDGLISTIASFCFRLDSNNNARLHSGWTLDPAIADSKEFVQAARKCVVGYYEKCMGSNSRRLPPTMHRKSTQNGEEDTWIFPLIQMGPFGISYDDDATLRILNTVPNGSKVKLATGYFNLTPNYIESIISNSAARFEILMAHPKANGFFGAKFPAGGIPAAYTLLAKRFLREAEASSSAHRIEMQEYLRPNWTFHGKGLWFYPPLEDLPFVTLIGSPNFGYRSVYLDLETQLYIVTTNKGLRQSLECEQERLYSYSKPFGEEVWTQTDRRVPLWVHLVIQFFKKFF